MQLCKSSLLFTLTAGSTPPKQQRAEETHPCHEVHSSPSVQQKCGHVNVAIVSSYVEGGEATLTGGESDTTHTQREKQIHYITNCETHCNSVQTFGFIEVYRRLRTHVTLHQTRTRSRTLLH